MNTPTRILVVLPFSANDGVLAEHLCDFIHLVNKRQQEGHCLLVCAGDVHDEMRTKVELAAKVAFAGVELIQAPKIVDPNKNVHINRMFKTAAEHVISTYRTPFLWLEPDCVPMKHGWLETIVDSHYEQAKRYSGPWQKVNTADGVIFLSRVAVYPPDTMRELSAPLATQMAFNIAAGPVVVPKSTKTNVIQQVAIQDESAKVLPSTVLAHSDKQGILMAGMRDRFEQAASGKKK